jgi:hypothetical protein
MKLLRIIDMDTDIIYQLLIWYFESGKYKHIGAAVAQTV